MLITFFHRRPSNIHFSLEKLFDDIRNNLPLRVSNKKWVSPYYSKGLFPRLKITWDARKNQGDVNHITGDIHFIALGLKKNKTILTIHDLGILKNTSNPLSRWILKTFWITLPVKFVKIVTVVSEATKQELLKATNVSPDKIRVIGNFIPDSFKPSPQKFNQTQPRILHIGSAYNKNLNRLTEALKGISCKLIIIGFPTEEQKELLSNYQIQHEIYSRLTENELIEQYQLCDMLSFASLLEGFGLPILEAQAIGRPVLTSNISSMPEVAGNGACLVEPHNINSIREGILMIINDANYRNELIKAGFENVKRFSLQEVTNQYTSLYQEIFNSSHK